MMTTEELVSEMGEEGALEFAGLLLATYGRKAGPAVEKITDAVDRSDRTYVDDVWADELVYHLVAEVRRGDSWQLGTACGSYVRYRTASVLLPLRRSVAIAQPCPACHDGRAYSGE